MSYANQSRWMEGPLEQCNVAERLVHLLRSQYAAGLISATSEYDDGNVGPGGLF